MDDLQRRLLDCCQRRFPLVSRPYAEIAGKFGVDEDEVIEALRALIDDGTASRIGPVFRTGRVGASTLAAMQVPEDRMQEVAALISAYPEVNHNYEREHRFNLWFVVAAASGTHA